MNANENRSMIDPEARVTELLRALPHVDAPGDFEARVRSSIASRRAGEGASGLPALRFALPAALVLLVAVGAIGMMFVSRPDTAVNVAPETPSAPTSAAPEAVSAPSEFSPGPPVTERAAVDTKPAIAPVRTGSAPRYSRRMPRSTPAGFSRDINSQGAPKVIVPKGIDPTSGNPSAEQKDFQAAGPLDVPVLLTFMGVEGEKTDGGWKVKSVAAGRIADHSGLKTGDIIESLDDTPLVDGSPNTGISFRSVQVLRGGKRVRIQLQNK